MHFDVKTASDYPTPDLVKFLNLSFEAYLVPIQFNESQFMAMVHKDGIDLSLSRVLTVDGNPIGVGLIAQRETLHACRLAAMGISIGMRGKGAGTWFMQELIREARERNEYEMFLEVIEQNEPAVALYQKSGFEIVRRLVGYLRENATEEGKTPLEEIDLHTAGGLISQYGLPNLPWQLSGETITRMKSPARAYKRDKAYAVISNPEAEHVVVWAVLVEPEARGNCLGTEMLKSVIAKHAGKTWHVPALLPEELGFTFEQAGFGKEKLSQWQMRRVL